MIWFIFVPIAALLLLSMPAMAESSEDTATRFAAENAQFDADYQECLKTEKEAVCASHRNQNMYWASVEASARDRAPTWLLVDGHQVSGPMEAGTCKRLAEKIKTFHCNDLTDCRPEARHQSFAECIQ